MKHAVALTVASLLTLLLLMVHLTQDVILQAEGSVLYPVPVVIFALMLYATLAPRERLWTHVVMLLGGFFGVGMIVLHAKGLAVGKSEGFLFVFTLFALSTTGWVTILLSAHGLAQTLRARRAGALEATLRNTLP